MVVRLGGFGQLLLLLVHQQHGRNIARDLRLAHLVQRLDRPRTQVLGREHREWAVRISILQPLDGSFGVVGDQDPVAAILQPFAQCVFCISTFDSTTRIVLPGPRSSTASLLAWLVRFRACSSPVEHELDPFQVRQQLLRLLVPVLGLKHIAWLITETTGTGSSGSDFVGRLDFVESRLVHPHHPIASLQQRGHARQHVVENAAREIDVAAIIVFLTPVPRSSAT